MRPENIVPAADAIFLANPFHLNAEGTRRIGLPVLSLKNILVGEAVVFVDVILHQPVEGFRNGNGFFPFHFILINLKPRHPIPKRISVPRQAADLIHPQPGTPQMQKTHEIIRENLDRSPLFSGMIEGTGPRYCPSIEDKVVKFADKNRHQVFIEPEGLSTNEMYIGGMSSSLPEDVQYAMYRSVPGLENARIVRNAYAIEYDCINARQLYPTLEFKNIKGLFSGGQFNGSSGYEEAAAQGLIAGINAAMEILGREMLILDRSESYIGVLIDDLVTKENHEPYRMMTSRA